MKRLLCVLPAVIGCIVIRCFGLPGTAAVLVAEILLLTLWRESRQHDGWMLLFSTLGIGTGYIIYPMASFPVVLGTGSLMLTIIIHAAMFLILSGFLKDK